jgi:dephospho-CoA kinase
VKVIGLTGGIGSGKSTVAKIFESLGIPVFNSDTEAKKLYQNKDILLKVKMHFGDKVFNDGAISFKKLAEVIFNSETELSWINKLIHPLVQEVFEQWKSEQQGDLVLKESAILIESGGHLHCDKVITIEADEQVRIKRVMERDNLSQSQVQERITKQLTDSERRKLADYLIYNNNETLNVQINELLMQLK